jgi:hypothetical protein
MADGFLASPKNRIVRVGTVKMLGRAKGVYTSVVEAEQIGVDVGVDSEGMFTDNGDGSAVIQIGLMPTSDSNDVLSAFMAARLPVPVTMAELGGRFVGGCARAMVTKNADVQWSDGTTVRMWTLVTTSWASHVGGASPTAVNTTVPVPTSYPTQ